MQVYLVIEISRIYLASPSTDFMINKKCLYSYQKLPIRVCIYIICIESMGKAALNCAID